jgi:hypothetical protein
MPHDPLYTNAICTQGKMRKHAIHSAQYNHPADTASAINAWRNAPAQQCLLG